MYGRMEIGDWLKTSELGSGSFGVVNLFKNIKTNEFIAVKQCKFQTKTSLNSKHCERWHNEVEIIKVINHPNIIAFKPLPDDLKEALLRSNPTELPLLSMEYCSGGSLRTLLKHPKNFCGLPENVVCDVLSDVSKGLRHLHDLKITHRDLKPDNIVLKDIDVRTVYKIIDLGFAKELNDATVSFVGTLHYLAPEIFFAEKYDHAVDYWSLGTVTFEIICGILPFLPDATPFDRFQKIRDKSDEEIFIYTSYSGSTIRSKNLKNENHISSPLKLLIEPWLRHVLVSDPNKRKSPIDSLPVLNYLQSILSRKIVKVFYTYKLEYYSYEINENTYLSTLIDWISRDIRCKKEEFFLIIGRNYCLDGETLVHLIPNFDQEIYIYRKDFFVSKKITYKIPKLVRDLVDSQIHELKKSLIAQIIYYISYEQKVLNSFFNSYKSYFLYVNYVVELTKNQIHNIMSFINNINMKIECYYKLRLHNENMDFLSNCDAYKNCLKNYRQLLIDLEKTETCLNERLLRIKRIVARQSLLRAHNLHFEKFIQSAVDLNKFLNATYQEVSTNSNADELKEQKLKKIISGVIKQKDDLLNNKDLVSYIKLVTLNYNNSNKFSIWLDHYLQHLKTVSAALDKNELNYHSIVFKEVRDQIKLNDHLDYKESIPDNLIQCNENIVQSLSVAIEEFGCALKEHLENIEILQLFN